jgi:hypothetical protein
MVRAILEGRKSMTRRAVKPQPYLLYRPETYVVKTDKWGQVAWIDEEGHCEHVRGHDNPAYVTCPYGMPGDRLWVRETHYAYGRWARNGLTKKGNEKWKFVRVAEMPVRFEEPEDGHRVSRDKGHPGKEQWYKRLARFMPRAYARITLEVTGVRVERLQEITEEDARAEGVEPRTREKGYTIVCRGGGTFEVSSLYERGVPAVGDASPFGEVTHVEPIPERVLISTQGVFRLLWMKINGSASWDANPWVWVVEFKRVGIGD